MRILIIGIILFIKLDLLLACDCKMVTKEQSYIMSDVVFIGQRIDDNNEEVFNIKIEECFKGDLMPEEVINLQNLPCSIHPIKSDIWLIYANKIDENKLYSSQCSWSRSVSNPYNINSKVIYKPTIDIDVEILKIIDELVNLNKRIDVKSDIQEFRLMKVEKEIAEIKDIANFQRRFIITICFVVFILILFCIFIYVKLFKVRLK